MITTGQVKQKPLFEILPHFFGLSHFGVTLAFDRTIHRGRQHYRRTLTICVRPFAEFVRRREEILFSGGHCALKKEICFGRLVVSYFDNGYKLLNT